MSDQLVSVIVRFHDPTQLWRLDRCLFSLLGQRHAPIQPILCLQSFRQTDEALVSQTLDQLCWSVDCARPLVLNVRSAEGGDIRSKLLNEGIRSSSSRYLAFLDFDDYWYANALSYLTERLRLSGAAIAFARVLRVRSYPLALYDYACEKTQPFKGNSMQDLFVDNFCPIHSYMLDRAQISGSDLQFDESFGVLEDYEFLLRIVAKYRADFSGVEKVIGEYVWRNDGSNTTPVGAEQDDARHRTWAEARKRLDEVKRRLGGSQATATH